MKKAIIFLFATAFLFSGCSKKPKEVVYMGQLYLAYGFGNQEKLYGKVKEVVQTNLWAEEVNGKITKGKPYSMADRKAITMTRDFKEEYNESGAVLRNTAWNDSGQVYLDIKCTTNGKMIEKSEYFMNDSIWAIGKHTYEDGRLIRIDGYAPGNDTMLMSIKPEYDPNGYCIKIQYYNKKGEPTTNFVIERNADGQIVKSEVFSRDGKRTSLVENTYNDKGEKVKVHEEYTNPARVVDRTYKYEYDKMGNWTAMIMYQDNKPWLIRAREFKYYE